MPTLTALGDSLTGVKPGNSREVEIAAKFRKQLAVLDGQLARMATGGASSQF
jgi:hypothetical protein